MPEIDLQSAIETNVLKLGELTLEAHFDRIIIVEDEFRSGYECARCNETGRIQCEDCQGIGSYSTEENSTPKKCSPCDGIGELRCPDCNGKGVLLAIPEQSERRPTTGTIVSTGEEVKTLHRGQGVIYPSFVGHVFDLNAEDTKGNEIKVCIRIMRESEVIAKVSGHLELRRVKKSLALVDA